MRIFLFLALAAIVSSNRSEAARNFMEDSFAISSIGASEAVVTGTPKDLKAGDVLYFNRSPFKFTVKDVKGDKVTVILPDRHDLKAGQALLRNPNEQIKKSIDTEEKLKKVLED